MHMAGVMDRAILRNAPLGCRRALKWQEKAEPIYRRRSVKRVHHRSACCSENVSR
jgi:hypothetical protein